MPVSNFIFALMVSTVAAMIFTPIAMWLAQRGRIIDDPKDAQAGRRIHKTPTPLLGGLAIFLSFNVIVLLYTLFTNKLTGDTILFKNILGICIGTVFLMIGGFLDDKYHLKPRWNIVWPMLAVLSVIICGLGIDSITNPFGAGIWHLNQWEIHLFWYHGFPYGITVLADALTFFWLLGLIYTTKLLDGLDGLVSGVTFIGAIFIFLTALNKGDFVQYDVALLALILAGVFFGFLVFNFNPANIFLGEGGSTLAGFLLGSLSIVSGSKIGLTLMLLSIPILDVLWTIVRRLREGHSPFASADRKHLHFRLLDAGFSVKQAVLFLYAIAVVFGLAAYYLQDYGLSLLFLGIIALGVFLLILAYIYKQRREREKRLTEI